ncbi:hypothetical protein TMatcc_008692 [Talaromyces marneffei ATCC 18224]
MVISLVVSVFSFLSSTLSITWKSNDSDPLFCTCKEVSNLSGLRVTLYTSPNSYGQALRNSSEIMLEDNPKSSLTVVSALLPKDSEDDLPRYSQFEERAKPC